jgi:hypothetical protein
MMVFGQLLPLAVALGFLLAWTSILIQTRNALARPRAPASLADRNLSWAASKESN